MSLFRLVSSSSRSGFTLFFLTYFLFTGARGAGGGAGGVGSMIPQSKERNLFPSSSSRTYSFYSLLKAGIVKT